MSGRHSASSLVSPATEGGPAAAQGPGFILVLLSTGSQEEQGCHLPPALPSSAWQLGPFLPLFPHSLRKLGTEPVPCWVALAGRKPEQQGCGAPELSRGSWGQLPSTAHSPPWGRTAQSAKGQVSNAPATSEEKHPLYYRPQSACGSARRTTFTQDVSIVQQGEEKRGTNPTDPTHGSLVLENVVVQQREAVGERGTSRDQRGHL